MELEFVKLEFQAVKKDLPKWNSSFNKENFFQMELECSKLEFQASKPTSCNFVFFPSHITASLSLSLSLRSLSFT